MSFILNLFLFSIDRVWHTFLVNWPFLLISVILSVLLKRYLDPQRASAFLMRHRNAGVVSATAVSVATPLCSCGTTAVILGMMANMMPWAPIVAFMVASPLTSPQELVYSAGLFGWRFALAFFVSSIVLGLAGGAIAGVLESKGWLEGQARLVVAGREPKPASKTMPLNPRMDLAASQLSMPAIKPLALMAEPAFAGSSPCLCSGSLQPVDTPSCSCAAPTISDNPGRRSEPVAARRVMNWRETLMDSFETGKRLLLMFLGFAFIGYFLNGLIPPSWVAAVFGNGRAYSIPLAATLGLPLYVNTEASLPLVRSLLDAGMSQGAALAFLITGAGTSFGAVAGAMTIARWRVIALVVGTLWAGAILIGIVYNLL